MRNLSKRVSLDPIIKTFTSECFATRSATVTEGRARSLLFFCLSGGRMDNIKLYEINRDYVNYLSPAAPYLFPNSRTGQANERKFIGIVLHINGMDYCAPLSSFKPKHTRMKEGLDFIKVRNYAVIN